MKYNGCYIKGIYTSFSGETEKTREHVFYEGMWKLIQSQPSLPGFTDCGRVLYYICTEVKHGTILPLKLTDEIIDEIVSSEICGADNMYAYAGKRYEFQYQREVQETMFFEFVQEDDVIIYKLE